MEKWILITHIGKMRFAVFPFIAALYHTAVKISEQLRPVANAEQSSIELLLSDTKL